MTKTPRIIFFDTKPYDRSHFERANADFGYTIEYVDAHLDRNTAGIVEDFNVVCAFVNDQIDAAVIETLAGRGVELVALRCAGYNNVDLKAAYETIHVVRVPGYSPYAVAEHATALMLALNRKTHRAYYRTRDMNFSINGLLGFDMHGKTLGVVGTGKIGKCLIEIARGFGMEILAFDRFEDEDLARKKGVRYVSLEDLYAGADIISLHCPLSRETHHMINRDSIGRMKDGVMIVNTGRGKLIDTESLIEAIKSKKIGAAGLDVYEEESKYFFEDFSNEMISDDMLVRLLMFPNVLVTSHQGFFTEEALTRISTTTLGNVREYYRGGYLENEICYRCGADKKHCRKKQEKRCFE